MAEPGQASGVTDELLAACVHCGFCVPVCPTWDLLREENDSPRGRLYLMRAEAEGRVDPAGAFSVHMDRCLGCRACESVCPAGVPFGHLLERARARIPPRPRARRRERWFLAGLTDPGVARFTYAIGRFARDTGIAKALGRWLPGRPGQVLRLLAASRPTWAPVESTEPAGSADSPAHVDSHHEGEIAGSYVLLTGCVMEGLFAHVHAATRRALSIAGFREIDCPEQACCGALHAHAGLLDEARELARQNIVAFERVECDWIVTDSAGCGAGLDDYPAWFEDEPEWRDRAEALSKRACDVTELLAAALGSSGEPPEAGGLAGQVGYDAPCHLRHGQGVAEEPIEVLRAIPGLEVEALPSSDRCCGGAGSYNLSQPDLAALVRAPKLGEMRRGGFDWIATGNPGCIMYLGAGLLRAGDRTPVVHPVELVDRAWS